MSFSTCLRRRSNSNTGESKMLSRRAVNIQLLRSVLLSTPRNSGFRGLAIASTRHLSTSSSTPADDSVQIESHTSKDTEDAVPWYLREDESSKLDKPIFRAEMPELPEDSPSSLSPTITHMINTLGLTDVKIFDVRNREDLPISTLSDIMIICQGKSEKHVQNATQELITFLKQQNQIQPFIEGLIKPNSLVRMRRRMKRRMINRNNNDKDVEFGVGPNSWVMVDTQVDGVFIHILTPERRQAINLEYMWCRPEEKELYKQTETRVSRSSYGRDEDSVFAGIFSRSYATERYIELDDMVLQQLKNGDYEGFKEVSSKVKNDLEVSTKVLDGIIEDFKTSNLQDILQNGAELHLDFFNESFPNEPTKQNFEQRFELLSLIHQVSSSEVTAIGLRDALYLQTEAGFTIEKPTLLKLIQVLNRSTRYNNPTKVLEKEPVNYHFLSKFNIVSEILSIIDISNPEVLDNEVILELLRLTTQQHLYTSDAEIIPVAGAFDTLVKFIKDRPQSDEIIEFILTSYLKSNQKLSFFEYWRSLYRHGEQNGTIVLDQRPWGIFLKLLDSTNHDNFHEVFIHDELPEFIGLEIPFTDSQKATVLSILNKFDESGVNYKDIRARLQ